MEGIETLLLSIDSSCFDYVVEKVINTIIELKDVSLLEILNLMSSLLDVRPNLYKMYAEAFACILNAIPQEKHEDLQSTIQNLKPIFVGFLVDVGVINKALILSRIGDSSMKCAFLPCADSLNEIRPNILEELDPQITKQIQAGWKVFYEAFTNDDITQIYKLTGKFIFQFGDNVIENHPLFFAAAFGAENIFKYFMKKGGSLKSPIFKTSVFESLAQAAVAGGNTQIVKILDEKQIDVTKYKADAVKYKRRNIFVFISIKENPELAKNPNAIKFE